MPKGTPGRTMHALTSRFISAFNRIEKRLEAHVGPALTGVAGPLSPWGAGAGGMQAQEGVAVHALNERLLPVSPPEEPGRGRLHLGGALGNTPSQTPEHCGLGAGRWPLPTGYWPHSDSPSHWPSRSCSCATALHAAAPAPPHCSSAPRPQHARTPTTPAPVSTTSDRPPPSWRSRTPTLFSEGRATTAAAARYTCAGCCVAGSRSRIERTAPAC